MSDEETYAPQLRGIHILTTDAIKRFEKIYSQSDEKTQILLESLFENSYIGRSGGSLPAFVYLSDKEARKSECSCWRDYDGLYDPRNKQWKTPKQRNGQ